MNQQPQSLTINLTKSERQALALFACEQRGWDELAKQFDAAIFELHVSVRERAQVLHRENWKRREAARRETIRQGRDYYPEDPCFPELSSCNARYKEDVWRQAQGDMCYYEQLRELQS